MDDYADSRNDDLPTSSNNTTMIVVIVVICVGVLGLCVVGMMVGLMFPAVNKVRDAASRARSQNNLKQIALAIHSHHDSNKSRFAYACDYGPKAPTGQGIVSLHFEMLPFIEGGNLYQQFLPNNPATYASPGGGAAPPGPAGVMFRTYLSPNDPSGPDGKTVSGITIDGINPPLPAGMYATTNYVVNGILFSPQPDPADKSGTIPPGFKTMLDGTSQTIMVTERYQVCKMGTGPAAAAPMSPYVYTLWGLGAYGAQAPTFALRLPDGDGVPTSQPGLAQFVPQSPVNGKVVAQYTPLGTAISAPGGFQVVPDVSACDARVPQALNPSGLIVAMGDGSTRIIHGNISAATFWATVTPAGNETLGADW